MGFLDFSALLSGMSKEAANVKTQRHQQENDNFMMVQQHLQRIIADPAVPDQTKSQARQAALDITMEHMGYNKKTKQINPVRKLVEGLVGQQPSGFQEQMASVGKPQQGVGSGNAKTQVGALPPSQPQAEMGSGPPPITQAEPPMPPPQLSGGDPWQMSPEEMGTRAGKEESAKADVVASGKRKQKSLDIQEIVNSDIMKGLPPDVQQNIKAVLMGGVSAVLPQGSSNTKSDPVTAALDIDKALQLYPEHKKQLEQIKATGIKFVLRDRDPKDPNIIRGFSPFENLDVYKSPQDIARQNSIDAYKEKHNIVGRELTATEEQEAAAIGTAMNAPPVPVFSGGVNTNVLRTDSIGKTSGNTPTTFDTAGNPQTGGIPGMSKVPPPAVSNEAVSEIGAYDFGINSLHDIAPKLKKAGLAIGPGWGRLTLLEVQKAGGLGADRESARLALDMQIQMMNVAFANGGKQLTGIEKQTFEDFFPSIKDTLQQAVDKTEGAMNYLQNKRKFKLGATPIRQREQLPANPPEAPAGSLDDELLNAINAGKVK